MKNIEYYERAAELLRYDTETGRLIRRVKTSNRAEAGDEAGTVNGMGYTQTCVTYNGKAKLLLNHRIIWFIHHGELPDFLDHIDGDRLNNRIDNLRNATRQQNNQNTRSRKNSSSKYLGVNWDKTTQKWLARIAFKGKTKNLGRFTNEIDAAKAYDSAARQYFGDYANPNFPHLK